MSIIRAPRPESNFYLLDKKIIEDRRLSWASRGLLVYLLGKPDHWRVSVAHLRNETADSSKPTGRDGVYALLDELIKAGYITRQQGRDDGGKMGEMNYIVSEAPLPPSPLPDQPDTVEPLPATATQVSIEVKQGLSEAKTEEPIGASAPTDPAFEAAWKAYPKREGANPKNKAQSAWKARLKEGITAEVMMAGVARYAAYCQAKGNTGTEYVMQAQRFFGKGREFEGEWASAAPKQSRHSGFDQRDYYEGLTERGDGTHAF